MNGCSTDPTPNDPASLLYRMTRVRRDAALYDRSLLSSILSRGIGFTRLDLDLILRHTLALQKPKLEIGHYFSQTLQFRISTAQIPRHEIPAAQSFLIRKRTTAPGRSAVSTSDTDTVERRTPIK
jgi:hypothetical protein